MSSETLAGCAQWTLTFEPMKVQTFISKTSIEGLYECVVRWFARPRKGQCNLVSVGPEIRYPASELTAIVTKDPAGNASFTNYLCQCFDYIFTFQSRVNSGSQALPRESCSGLMEPDTLISDNICQLLRCHYGSEAYQQTLSRPV